MPANDTSTGRSRLNYGAAYCLFFLIAIVPIWSVHHPPLQDYPNHLARIYVLRHADQAPLDSFYTIDWQFIPNMAMDLLVPAMNALLPLPVAGRIFLTMAFFLLTFGAVFLARTVHGRLSPLPFLGFLLLFNFALHKGFLNFLFACGAALVFIALWIRAAGRPAWQRLALGVAQSLFLFVAHLYGLAIYAFFTLAYEVLATRRGTSGAAGEAGARLRRLAVWLPQFILPALLFLVLSPTSAGLGLADLADRMIALVTDGHWLFLKLAQLRFLFLGYEPILDLAVAALLLALTVGIYRAGGRMPQHFLVPLGAALIAYLFVPRTLLTSAHADWRLLVPLAFITAATTSFPFTGRLASRGALAAIGLLLALQAAVVTAEWRAGEQLYRDYRTVAAAVRRGARVFPYSACSEYGELVFPTPVLHLSTLMVIDRHAFVPSLFAFDTQQILRYRDGFGEVRERSDRVFYPGNGIDWAYVEEHYDYALNIDRAFAPGTACAPPPDWDVAATAGQLTLLARPGRQRAARIDAERWPERTPLSANDGG